MDTPRPSEASKVYPWALRTCLFDGIGRWLAPTAEWREFDCVFCHVSRHGITGPGRFTAAPHEVIGDTRFRSPVQASQEICAHCHEEDMDHGRTVTAWKQAPFGHHDFHQEAAAPAHRSQDREAIYDPARRPFASCRDAAADRVLDAIVKQRFYILTHEGSEQAVETRMQGIIKGDAPAPPMEGIGAIDFSP